MKVTVQKGVSDGEYITVEETIPSDVMRHKDKKRLRAYLSMGFDLVDDRLFEMNRRIMLANELVRKQSPDVQFIVHSVLEGMHGVLYRGHGAPPPDVTPETLQKVADDAEEARETVDTRLGKHWSTSLDALRSAGIS